LTIEDETRNYEPGDSSDIPAGTTHAARLGAGCCVIDVFQDPDRYAPK
jgi:quercetin dioxygenase-like cupin family protein